MAVILTDAYQALIRERIENSKRPCMILGGSGENGEKKTAKTYVFQYRDHLTNNPEIFHTVAKEILEGPQIIKLVASCGSGKTYGILHGLAEKLRGKKHLVIAFPTKVLTMQSSQYPNNKVVIGRESWEGEKDLDYSMRCANSMVYDKLGYLTSEAFRRHHENYEEIYANMVLVIDEAHNLYDAKTYRARCVSTMRELAKLVYAYGGSVIYMTGTPRKLEGFFSTCNIWCVRTDQNGHPVREINVNRICLMRIKGKGKLDPYIVGVIRDSIMNGYRPIVRINDKNRIRKLKASIEAAGFRVQTLSADDKGYYTVKEEKRTYLQYDSEFYSMVLNQAALPDADCYLVTSVLEEGTSLRSVDGVARYKSEEVSFHGVADDALNQLFEKKNLLPIYVALNPGEMDTDHIRQFFARPRFEVEKGIILTRYTKDEYAEKHVFPDERTYLARYFEETVKKEQMLSQSGTDRFDGKSALEEKESSCLKRTEHGWEIDVESLIAEAYRDYDRQIYYMPQYAEEMLKQIFAVPVEVSFVTDETASGYKAGGVKVNQETQKVFKETFREKADLKEWIIKIPTMADNDTTKSLRQLPDGPQLLSALRFVLADNRYSTEEAVDLAVLMLKEGKTARVTSRIIPEQPMVSISREITDSILFQMSGWKNLNDLMHYMYREMQSRNLLNDVDVVSFACNAGSPSAYQLHLIGILKSTSYFEPFLRMLKVTNGRNTWEEVCMFACMHTVADCELYIKAHLITKWNRLECGSPAYQKTVLSSNFVSGAEYDLLRGAGESFFLADVEKDEKGRIAGFQYKKDAAGAKIPMFPKGLINKVVKPGDLEMMAAQMVYLVKKKLTGQKFRSRSYSPKDIEVLLRMIYTTAEAKAAKPAKKGEVKEETAREETPENRDEENLIDKLNSNITGFVDEFEQAKSRGIIIRSLRVKGVGTSYKTEMTRKELVEILDHMLFVTDYYSDPEEGGMLEVKSLAVTEQEMDGQFGEAVENLCDTVVSEDAAKAVRYEITKAAREKNGFFCAKDLDFLIHSAQVNKLTGLPVSLKDRDDLPDRKAFQMEESLLWDLFESLGRKPMDIDTYDRLRDESDGEATVRECLNRMPRIPWTDEPVKPDRWNIEEVLTMEKEGLEDANPEWKNPDWANKELEAEHAWYAEEEFRIWKEIYGEDWHQEYERCRNSAEEEIPDGTNLESA